VSQRDWDDTQLINAALDICRYDSAFAYRFVADELRDRGLQVSSPARINLSGSIPMGTPKQCQVAQKTAKPAELLELPRSRWAAIRRAHPLA
jgi:hypothetical protein